MDVDGLSNDQYEKVLQFQDLTGIEDLNVCRDVLIRNDWNLEVAFQQQLNIREGRPTVYASSSNARAPAVINDQFMQQIFSTSRRRNVGRNSSDSPWAPRGFTGFIGYVIQLVFNYCYSTLTSILTSLLNFGRNDDRLVTDPLGDVLRFIEAYNEKYPQHPVFYQGTYAQALNDAKQELRFLLVYLHKHSETNSEVESFCSETLSDQRIIDYVNQNTLFWACDVSSPEGYRVSHSINAHTYPVMVMIGLRSSRMIIMGRFEGDCTSEELLRRLQTVIASNELFLMQERSDRLERNFNQTLRQQQDEAYQQSLRADEEKERLKEIELLAMREKQEAEKRLLEEAEKRKEEIIKMKLKLLEEVPTEPPLDSPSTICVVFKLPNGERLERRFCRTNSINDVYNYLFCHPLSPDDFEITTNFPKRVLYNKSNCGECKTLAEVGLKNREVLFVHDLDA
ncbi:FAS-associated factor 2 [Teleopsis dalmanni]|uniref:FAS-associated factor 2 n=1 Tax=Teleopsis dalmanni TaxID=139649 RepID=UPI0018CCF45C|nr:FAS-associated factor 2 [Teleopsis dalmanni]XP_037958622.1 FAS-associated factor 2 [Teleopsis dalmanni]XP_037958623.1 FAS-associated factor 2 [Teleopsis dalmanni]XP_037958624.1 FAS-associated factor 2 [Teleopsis dalmanni]XP_037958625.1 FAS-associated factor 2 [Teleopsis dalmanni]